MRLRREENQRTQTRTWKQPRPILEKLALPILPLASVAILVGCAPKTEKTKPPTPETLTHEVKIEQPIVEISKEEPELVRPPTLETTNPTVLAARGYLGVKYGWGGRSHEEIDCLGVLFLAHAEVFGTNWRKLSGMPTKLAKQLGGISAVYNTEEYLRDPARVNAALNEGDYIFFLYADSSTSDAPLPGTNYWVYHTAISTGNGYVIHANPFPDETVRKVVTEEYLVDFFTRVGYDGFAVITNAAQAQSGSQKQVPQKG
ncbi:MAG: NlpC/P60 family protein [Candidatus Micrarchaeota archaeon]